MSVAAAGTRAGDRINVVFRNDSRVCRTLSFVAIFCFELFRSVVGAQPMASQLHVVSAHVADARTFNDLFLFFRDTLELPPLYGEPCDPSAAVGRHYAGFSLGNAYLEPCGPYEDDRPFAADSLARWHGLTFLVARSARQEAVELTVRGIAHSGVMGERFVYVREPSLVGPFQAVSFWEQDVAGDTGLRRIESTLRETHRGGLGVRRLKTVELGIRAKDGLDRWSTLLGVSASLGRELHLEPGPTLRFVESQQNEVRALELELHDLGQGRRFLERKGLLGEVKYQSVAIDPAKSFGLRLIFTGSEAGSE